MGIGLTFLGGAGTVTGSKYLLERDDTRILVDCGLFQGFKTLRLKNWAPLPVDPATIDAVVLTHAHIDHSGYLPILIKNGFKGPIYCSQSTFDLCKILLPDAGYLQEKDADLANRHGFSKHHPALPLFGEKDARRALEFFRPIAFDQDHRIGEKLTIRLRRAGHILGAASVGLNWSKCRIVFSGDLGRYGDPIMVDPTSMEQADYLLLESTYGDRLHQKLDPAELLLQIVTRTVSRGGTVLIPAFAVGRAQNILFHFDRLKRDGRLPDVPIFLDSPMAQDASDIFCARSEDHRLAPADCRRACSVARYIRSVEESKALTANAMPKVIISSSGMATGGRVLHHLKRYAPDFRSTILFAGYQAGGTRGAAMTAGAQTVKIHGSYVPVRADVRNLDMMSAHADADELMRWLGGFHRPPRITFLVHGEPTPADTLRRRIEEELQWRCVVAEHGQTEMLS